MSRPARSGLRGAELTLASDGAVGNLVLLPAICYGGDDAGLLGRETRLSEGNQPLATGFDKASLIGDDVVLFHEIGALLPLRRRKADRPWLIR